MAFHATLDSVLPGSYMGEGRAVDGSAGSTWVLPGARGVRNHCVGKEQDISESLSGQRKRKDGRKRPRQELSTPGLNIAPAAPPQGPSLCPWYQEQRRNLAILAFICQDAFIRGSPIHWRDLITGAHLTFGVADALPGRPDQRTGTRKL